MLQKKLHEFQSYFSAYTELRLQQTKVSFIELTNGAVTANSKITDSGVSARVFSKGHWGFASHSSTDEMAIKKVIADATKHAQFLNQKNLS